MFFLRFPQRKRYYNSAIYKMQAFFYIFLHFIFTVFFLILHSLKSFLFLLSILRFLLPLCLLSDSDRPIETDSSQGPLFSLP